MKWGRKKLSSESPSSRNSLISHVFPVSWLSKFKQKSGDVGAKPVKVKQEGKRNSAFAGSPECFNARGGRFYGDEGYPGKASRCDLSSVWYYSDDKLVVSPSACRSCGSNATTTLMGNEEIHKFNNLILDARKMKELKRNAESFPEMEIFKAEEKAVTLKVTTKDERKIKKMNQRNPKEKSSKLETYPNEAEDDDVVAFQILNGVSAENFSSERERLKEMKIKEIKSKSENHRKSLYINRELQTKKSKQMNSKVKVGSPRIKALEDMKRAKLKMKGGKEKPTDGRTKLDSFAVVKCSFNPQKDFRDSMIEMILEKKFSRPEELEELLACYLTLNPDEYHDLIIRVFRQVWLELNQDCFEELQNQHYFDN